MRLSVSHLLGVGPITRRGKALQAGGTAPAKAWRWGLLRTLGTRVADLGSLGVTGLRASKLKNCPEG